MRFLAVLIAFHSALSWAEEADEFIRPGAKPPASSTGEINRMVNDRMREFVEESNTKGISCEPMQLNRDLLFKFNGHWSEFGNIMRDHMDGKKSDYKLNFAGYKSKSGTAYEGTKIRAGFAQTLNVDGLVVGYDKIDHFFSNGGMVFEKYIEQEANRDVPHVQKYLLLMNSNQEESQWGLGATGVKSYGDLSANWSGFQFYKDLAGGPRPFFTCENGKIRMNREFKIQDYIRPSWSEAYNCSSYRDAEMATQVAANLKAAGLSCPADPAKCEEIVKLYPNEEERRALVSPVCRGVVAAGEAVETKQESLWEKAAVSKGLKPDQLMQLINHNAKDWLPAWGAK